MCGVVAKLNGIPIDACAITWVWDANNKLIVPHIDGLPVAESLEWREVVDVGCRCADVRAEFINAFQTIRS